MDEDSKLILKMVGFEIDDLKDIDGLVTPRESLISDDKYDQIKILIPGLKKHYSSSFMTSLQNGAEKMQKWPLLNLIAAISTNCLFALSLSQGALKSRRNFQDFQLSQRR